MRILSLMCFVISILVASEYTFTYGVWKGNFGRAEFSCNKEICWANDKTRYGFKETGYNEFTLYHIVRDRDITVWYLEKPIGKCFKSNNIWNCIEE